MADGKSGTRAALKFEKPRGDPNYMTSLARGFWVLRALSGQRRPSTISQLSMRTGLSRAVVRRCVYTLEKLGCLGTDDQRHYYLQRGSRNRAAWRAARRY